MLLPRRFPLVFSSIMFLPSSIPVERTLTVSVAQEFGKNPTGEKGRKVATRSRSNSFNGSAVQSRESSIDVAKHMLRSRREKGDWVYVRRAQYLLSSWHSHLSSKAATKKGVLVLYRVATTILALTITERPMVVDHARASSGGGGGGIPISRLPPSNPPSSDQIFFVSRIGNPETILSLRDQSTREKFDVALCALSPANKMPRVNFGSP
ncbi:hypothetical protein K0M31_004681 [Melipona bicolor]|uniref:Uncharacterized protein n=1 Tax=Melipona bicolor TaxID=60889 RepID=A0AA40KNT6_9HYME|nr:hypothetical protein K0M31_004681 [Melipona bicolor]